MADRSSNRSGFIGTRSPFPCWVEMEAVRSYLQPRRAMRQELPVDLAGIHAGGLSVNGEIGLRWAKYSSGSEF